MFDHNLWVSALGIAGNCNYLLSASFDKTVRIWDICSGKEIARMHGPRGKIASAAVNGDTLITGDLDGSIIQWDLSALERRAYIPMAPGGGFSNAVCRTRILAGTLEGTLNVVDWPAFTLNSQRSAEGFSAMAISADGKRAITGVYFKDAGLLWNLESELPPVPLNVGGSGLSAAALSADGRLAVTGSGKGRVGIWALDRVELLREMHEHSGPIISVAIGLNNRTAITGSRDGTARIWDMANGCQLHLLAAHPGIVQQVAISDAIAVTISTDQVLRVWNAEDGTPIANIPTGSTLVNCLSLSPDGKIAAIGDDSHNVQLFDLHTCARIARFQSETEITALAFAEDGNEVYAASSTGFAYSLRIMV